jgi:hypothetical protein
MSIAANASGSSSSSVVGAACLFASSWSPLLRPAHHIFMKNLTALASLIMSLCLFGCSRETAGLVPRTAAKLETSEFNLEHTTPSGVKCYVREITRETAAAIPPDSRDGHFLEKHKQPYLQVFVCNARIVDLRAIKEGEWPLNTQQASDVFAWGVKRGMAADGADKEQEATAKMRGISLGQRYY